jgi:hypothetical protein
MSPSAQHTALAWSRYTSRFSYEDMGGKGVRREGKAGGRKGSEEGREGKRSKDACREGE